MEKVGNVRHDKEDEHKALWHIPMKRRHTGRCQLCRKDMGR